MVIKYLDVDKNTNVIEGVYRTQLFSTLIPFESKENQKIYVGFDTFVNGKIISTYNEEVEKAKYEIRKEISELKEKLTKTDYLAIKFSEGELTEEEFAPHRAERRRWREKIRQLEEELD